MAKCLLNEIENPRASDRHDDAQNMSTIINSCCFAVCVAVATATTTTTSSNPIRESNCNNNFVSIIVLPLDGCGLLSATTGWPEMVPYDLRVGENLVLVTHDDEPEQYDVVDGL